MLIGSDKQVEWANGIRRTLISKWEKDKLFQEHKKYISRQYHAAWWISVYKDNRTLADICPKTKAKEERATLEAFFS